MLDRGHRLVLSGLCVLFLAALATTVALSKSHQPGMPTFCTGINGFEASSGEFAQDRPRSSWSKEGLVIATSVLLLFITILKIIVKEVGELGAHAWELFKRAVREIRLFRRELRTPLPPTPGRDAV